MRLSKLRIVIAVLIVAAIFGVLTLLFWGFVRDTFVVPIYYVVWVGGLILKSIPQGIFAGLLALIGLVIALNTLSRLPRRADAAASPKKITQIETRYQYWRRLTEILATSQFSRKLFVGDARKLIQSILAYEHGIDAAEIPDLVKSGQLELPDGIRALLQQSDSRDEPPAPPAEPILRRLTRLVRQMIGRDDAPNPAHDPLVAEIVTFIDTHLETVYAGDQSEA